MALNSKEYKQRVAHWLRTFKANTRTAALPSDGDTLQTYCIECAGLKNFKPPTEIAQRGDVVCHF